jgi:type VI secretion system secreted protein VgrG
VPYYPPEETDRRERDYISEWTLTQQIQPGVCALNDYDFMNPKGNLQVKASVSREHEQANFEIYDYPGEFYQPSDGEHYVRTRIEEAQSQYEIVNGSGNVSGLNTGCLFKLANYPREDQNREYLVIASHYTLGPQEYESQNSGDDGYFTCSFSAIDSKENFRAERSTPKPMVQGPQSATVVGMAGEEIWTDEYGRVKVQFPWDRYGKSDENSSCWVRVAQIWAGKNWGGMYIPRIGQEVIVDFMEGDPDRPLITGRVYNQNNMPPYGLPAEKTKSTIKSNSSKGGGGSNEFRFEDLKGSEEIYLHGQKDWTIAIENDKNQTVGHDETHAVGNDRSKTVGHDQSETIGNNKTIQVGSNHSEQIGSNMTITVGANLTETVAINSAETIGVAKELTIGAAYAETVGASKAVNVGKDVSTNIGSNQSTSVGKDETLKVGKNLVIDAGDSITIKTGKAQISMKKDGTITIQGKDITLKGSGAINVKASKNVAIKGKKILEN